MALPTSRNELQLFILQELGHPVVTVNVSMDQIDNCINKAMEYFHEYNESGSERTYLAIQLTQPMIDDKKITLPDNVISVVKVLTPNNSDTGMFSFPYQFWQANAHDIINFGGMVGYFITNQYLSEINKVMNPDTDFRFKQVTGELYLDTNTTRFPLDSFIVVECYAYLDQDVHTKIWGNRYIRDLATALTKKVYGFNLSKYNAVLPNGVTTNGLEIYNQAIQEIKDAEAEIRNTSEPYGFLVA